MRCWALLVLAAGVSQPTARPTSIPTAGPIATQGPQTAETDAQALCDVRAGFVDASKLTNWCTSADPCSTGARAWFGVTCGLVNGAMRVVEVSLDVDKSGTLATAIGNLGALT